MFSSQFLAFGHNMITGEWNEDFGKIEMEEDAEGQALVRIGLRKVAMEEVRGCQGSEDLEKILEKKLREGV